MIDWFFTAIGILGWFITGLIIIQLIDDYRYNKRRKRLDKEWYEEHKNDPPSQGSSISWPLSYQIDDDRYGRIPKGYFEQ